MTEIRLRPRFEIMTSLSPGEFSSRFKQAVADEHSPCQGKSLPNYAVLRIPQKDQHYWSPQLSISIEDTDEGTLLRCLFGPRPAVWTMFIFFYAILALAGTIAGMYGLSQWTLEKPAYALLLVPFFIILAIAVYLTARTGQKMGHDQMVIEDSFLRSILGNNIIESEE
jgi:hypothetical protein